MNPKEPKSSNREWLQLYADTILAAGELADQLKTDCAPDAQDAFYRVSDPRTLKSITIPTLLSAFNLRYIEIGYSISETEDGKMAVYPSLIYAFNEGEAHVDMDEVNEGDHTIYYFPKSSSEGYQTIYTGISDQEMVTTVARLVRPYADPTKTGFSSLSDQSFIEDTRAVLDKDDLTSKVSVSFYTVDGRHVIVSEENNRITEVALRHAIGTETDYSIIMRVSYRSAGHEIEIFQTESENREPIPANEQEVSAYKDIVDDLLAYLKDLRESKITEVTYDERLEEEDPGLSVRLQE